MLYLLIGVCGAIGVLSRYGVDRFFSSFLTSSFPVATFSINIAASFLLGLLHAFSSGRQLLAPEISLALGVGLLGGFSTFSSYSLQTLLLGQQKQYAIAFAYFGLSPLLGLLAAWLGVSVGKWFGF